MLLRGVNARVDGIFDVSFDDGRVALETVPEMTDEDCLGMRAVGFNLLRLPVNWSGIEPNQGTYEESYLTRVDEAVRCAHDAGLFVLIDFHQDAYSKEIGEDGAPLWAIVPAPEMLLEGPLTDLEARRTSPQVAAAFESFFDPMDAAGLQAAFFAMIEHVARRYATHPGVIGFEIFNEPVIDADKLDPFHFAAAAVLRAAAPEKLIFFEPPAIRNFLDFQPLAAEPFPVSGAVYSPHIYTFVFRDEQNRLATLTKEDLRTSIDNARAEAQAWGTPLFIGEYGIGPTRTNADLWIQYQNELQDEYLASNAFWLWKEESQGRWGLFDYDEGTHTWTERPQVRDWVSRVYPQRIAGTVDSLTYDGATDTMTLVSQSSSQAPHVIYVPARISDQLQVRCNGEGPAVARDAASGTIEVTCSGTLHVGTTIPF